MQSVRELEKYVLQVALARGLIDRQRLTQAAQFRQKQTDAGRTTSLLRVLRPFVSPKGYAEIEGIWNQALRFASAQAGAITASDIDSGLQGDAAQGKGVAKRSAPGPRRMRDSTIDRLLE